MHDRTILIFISLIFMERTFFRAAATSKANGKKLEKVPEEMEVEENIQDDNIYSQNLEIKSIKILTRAISVREKVNFEN